MNNKTKYCMMPRYYNLIWDFPPEIGRILLHTAYQYDLGIYIPLFLQINGAIRIGEVCNVRSFGSIYGHRYTQKI